MKWIPQTLTLLLFLAMSGFAKKTPVVKVGKGYIYKETVDSLVNILIKQQFKGQSLQADQKSQLIQIVSGNLIGQELLDLEASATGIKISPAEVDSLNTMFRKSFPDEKAFQSTLKAMDIKPTELKDRMAKELRINKILYKKLTPLEKPSEEEMKKFFNSNKKFFPANDSLRASQIVLKAEKNTSVADAEAKRQELEKIRAKLIQETSTEILLEKFTRLALKYSQTPEAARGGDVQAYAKGDFFPEFHKKSDHLQVGQLSEVFRSPLGFHLVLLTEKNDGSYANSRLKIMQYLVNQQTWENQKKLSEYFQVLVKKHKVEVLNPEYGAQPSAQMGSQKK